MPSLAALGQSTLAPIPNGTVHPSLRVLQAIAILLATSGAGASAAVSLCAVPQILEARSGIDVTTRWLKMQALTQNALRASTIWAPSVLHLVLGYKLPRQSRLYYYLTCASLCLVPWHYVRMAPIQWKMERRKKMASSDGDKSPLIEYTPWGKEDSFGLVELWGSRNLYAAALSFATGCVGLYAALS